MSAPEREKNIGVSFRKLLRVRFLFLAAGLCASDGLPAQTPSKPDPVSLSAPLITLHVTVTDIRGTFVAKIPQSAFKVMEDGIEQSVKDFRSQDRPVSMGLIIDHSASMRDNRTLTLGALATLVSKAEPQDELFVVNFDDDVYLDQSFTNNKQNLTEAFEKPTFRGASAMRNAVSGAIDYLKTDAKRDTKVIVVVTDGEDTASREITLEQLLRKVRDSGVMIYTIGVLNQATPIEARAAKRALNVLAEISDGLSFYPKDVSELSSVVQMITEVHNEYLLRYSTNSALNVTSRDINVTVGGYRGIRVRIRKGD